LYNRQKKTQKTGLLLLEQLSSATGYLLAAANSWALGIYLRWLRIRIVETWVAVR
jgi:hypothetical protein